MTFQKLNIPDVQSTFGGVVLYQSWTVTIQKKMGLSSVGFFLYKKFYLFYIK